MSVYIGRTIILKKNAKLLSITKEKTGNIANLIHLPHLTNI